MRRLKKAILDQIGGVNAQNAERIQGILKQVTSYFLDVHKEDRRKQGLCKACLYFPQSYYAGAGFTAWSCRVCGKEQPHHPNTHTPYYCPECTQTHRLCCRCGGSDV